MKEVKMLKVFQGDMDGKIEIQEASRILKRRLRSVYRMVKKAREREPEGVLHGNRNKVNPRRVPDSTRKKLIDLALRKIGPLKASPKNSLDRCKVVWCKAYCINVRHFFCWVNRPFVCRAIARLR